MVGMTELEALKILLKEADKVSASQRVSKSVDLARDAVLSLIERVEKLEADKVEQVFWCLERLKELGIEVEKKIESPVRKFLDLSTAHVTEATNDWLGTVKTSLIIPHEYGYWIAVSVDPENDFERPDLKAIQAYARERECDWVLLDRDADTVDDLPTYEW